MDDDDESSGSRMNFFKYRIPLNHSKVFICLFSARQAEFRAEALAAKKRHDKFIALGFMRVAKQFDTVVEAYNAGQQMNLDELPTVAAITAALEHDRFQQQQDVVQRSAGL